MHRFNSLAVNKIRHELLILACLAVSPGCETTERAQRVATAIAAHYSAGEVSVSIRNGQELIVTLVNPDYQLLAQADPNLPLRLAREAHETYGDSPSLRAVRVRLISRTGIKSLELSRPILDTAFAVWQVRTE